MQLASFEEVEISFVQFLLDVGWREEKMWKALDPGKGPASNTPRLFWSPATTPDNAPNFVGLNRKQMLCRWTHCPLPVF